MLVNDAMSRSVETCGQDDSLAEAARRMVDDEHGALPVTLHGYLIGIISERDVLRAVADGRSPVDTSVREFMTLDPDALEPDIEVMDAADWMLAAGYRHLPVVDEGKILGIVSMKDLMWAITEGTRGLSGRPDHAAAT